MALKTRACTAKDTPNENRFEPPSWERQSEAENAAITAANAKEGKNPQCNLNAGGIAYT